MSETKVLVDGVYVPLAVGGSPKDNKSDSYSSHNGVQTEHIQFTYKITPLLSKLAIITEERLETLRALETCPKTANQVRLKAGGTYHSQFYHLRILQNHGFVSSTVMNFPCTSFGKPKKGRAKKPTKDVTVYGLSELGKETVEYFGEKRRLIKGE